MKRILSVCLTVLLLVALAACGAEENVISFDQSDSVSAQETSDTSVVPESQENEEQEPTQGPSQVPEESVSEQEEETVNKTLIAIFR